MPFFVFGGTTRGVVELRDKNNSCVKVEARVKSTLDGNSTLSNSERRQVFCCLRILRFFFQYSKEHTGISERI